MALNQSKVKSFRRCQKQFSFRYDAAPGKELVRKVPKLALSRGSWMHELQEAHHRKWAGLKGKKADWRSVHERNTQKFNSYFEEDRAELGNLPDECLRLFRSYLRFWGTAEDEYNVATLHDGSPAIEFVVEVPLDRWGIKDPFKGRIDLLVEDLRYDGLWIWDSKWVRSIPNTDERMMSPQALLYAWALKKLGYDIRGFVYNYGRTKAPTVPRVLKRPAGTLSTAKRMDTDIYTYVRAIKELHGDNWKHYAKTVYKTKIKELRGREGLWFRRERMPVENSRIKRALAEFIVSSKDIERRSKKHPPRSYFYNCSHYCDYHQLCVTEFQGLDITPLIKSFYEYVPERYHEEEDLLIA